MIINLLKIKTLIKGNRRKCPMIPIAKIKWYRVFFTKNQKSFQPSYQQKNGSYQQFWGKLSTGLEVLQDCAFRYVKVFI